MPATPGPTASTIPAPSCPHTDGVGAGKWPARMWASDPQMPAATIRIATSPGPGGSSSISAICNGWLCSRMTAAVVLIDPD